MKLHIHWYEFASSGRADLVWSNSERALGRVYVTTAKCRCGKVRMSLRNLVATDPLPPSIGSVRDDVHDGLHGDVFALSAGSFSGEVGTAFVALPASVGAGRRVDIEVRLIP